jgi:cellulose synthase/poly-beta-1,6-N-acetylglucosamine synthase-like glycosyltransferase
MEIIFLIALASITYIWLLYPLLIRLIQSFVSTIKTTNDLDGVANPVQHRISVVIAAYNEAENLSQRVENIFSADYPQSLIEVVIVSDGSTDATTAVAHSLKEKYKNLKLVELTKNVGKASAHNQAIPYCSAQVLVFTDAETLFETDFIAKITAPFANQQIGFASGVLNYQNISNNTVSQSAGLYWRLELLLRQWESDLGILAIGTGACSAVRKELFRELPPTGDEDFTTPLDVVMQGYRCVHISEAIAYDKLPDTPTREFRARIRMTAKNFHGTLTRWGTKNIFRYPWHTISLFSHKIGRWLTPFALLALFVSNSFILDQGGFYVFTWIMQLAFYLLAMLGFFNLKIPLAGQVYSFVLVNIAFFIGIIKALTGQIPRSYTPTSRS